MAASLMPIQPPFIIRASATISTSTSTSGHHKSDLQRKNWWSPLFGWSSEPDYIDSSNSGSSGKSNSTFTAVSEPDLDRKTTRSRKSPASFTDEKARKLRLLTVETESFHDAMYHSAIASRLASDFSDRSDL